MNRQDIERVVLRRLEELTDVPVSRIRPTDQMVRDLQLDGDDFSFCFVPPLERSLGVRTTQADWDNALTVQDAVDVFVRRAQEGDSA